MKTSQYLKQSVTLVIDVANLDGVLTGLLGRKPSRFDRPDYLALLTWARREFGGQVRGYAVVKEPTDPRCFPFLGALTMQGYAVVRAERYAAMNGICRPSSSEVDDHVCEFLLDNAKSDVVVMVGHDWFAAVPLLEQLERGARCLAVGFPEMMSHLVIDTGVDVVDIEDLGVYGRTLPRFHSTIE